MGVLIIHLKNPQPFDWKGFSFIYTKSLPSSHFQMGKSLNSMSQGNPTRFFGQMVNTVGQLGFYWAACGKPSYKMELVFLLAQIALWRVQHVRKI